MMLIYPWCSTFSVKKRHQQKTHPSASRELQASTKIIQNPPMERLPKHKLLVIQVRGSSSRWYFDKFLSNKKQIQEFKGILAIYPPQRYPPPGIRG